MKTCIEYYFVFLEKELWFLQTEDWKVAIKYQFSSRSGKAFNIEDITSTIVYENDVVSIVEGSFYLNMQNYHTKTKYFYTRRKIKFKAN